MTITRIARENRRNQQDYIKTGSGLIWYNGQIDCVASGTPNTVADVLRATPFIIRKGFSIDRIEFEVTTIGVGFMVVGIYDSKTDGTLYPNNLIVQGTQQDTNIVGLHVDTITATLLSDTLYWLVYNANTALPIVRGMAIASVCTVLGNDGTAAATRQHTSWTVARVYNSVLPNPFTAGGTLGAGLINPLIQVRTT